MRVALDVMGSDGAPDVELEGAVRASLENDTEIICVGDQAIVEEKLAGFGKKGSIRVVHAPEAITMDEQPVVAVRKKKEASLLVALRLVKQGEADAIVSAGNTGAVMIGSRAVLGCIRGVARCAIGQALPTITGEVVMLDLGANVDCTTRHLCEFAEMGIAYSRYSLGVEQPRLGLLNIGQEMQKGGQVAREAYLRLQALPHINFVGNVEPPNIFQGAADVVVCDGFVGNLFLKTSEAAGAFMGKMIREHFESSSRSKLGALLARNALKDLRRRVDPNEYPGAPLLGINGVVIIVHGSATPTGVANAIAGARTAVENRLTDHVRENIELLRTEEQLPRTGAESQAPPGTGPEEAPAGEEPPESAQ